MDWVSVLSLFGSVTGVWVIFLRPLAKDMKSIGDKVTSMDISIIDMNLALTKHIGEDTATQVRIKHIEDQLKELKASV